MILSAVTAVAGLAVGIAASGGVGFVAAVVLWAFVPPRAARAARAPAPPPGPGKPPPPGPSEPPPGPGPPPGTASA